ncbi:MAG: lysophospholipid acyltransferase family protein [Hyphomonadaceae bacterium]|nr:lysophospholipid acyltransferase family protein [Hyphomonadaceae bacterium]
MLKRLFASRTVQRLAGALVGVYIRAAGATSRWTFIGQDIPAPIWSGGGPAIYCFWHGRLAEAHKGWTIWPGSQPVKVLISQSRDGEVIAAALPAIKCGSIRGSSAKGDKRKGGVQAMREMLRHLAQGGCVAIAPDGPRGPRMRAQPGVVQLAQKAQAPIVCVGWAMAGEKPLQSWDRFVLPRLFGRGVVVWGGPLRIQADAGPAELDAARRRLEAEIQRVTDEACARAGVAAITPEPETPAPVLERAAP